MHIPSRPRHPQQPRPQLLRRRGKHTPKIEHRPIVWQFHILQPFPEIRAQDHVIFKHHHHVYPVCFDAPGSESYRFLGKMLASSLVRTFFTGEVVVFRNSPAPLFLVERKGLEEVFLETPDMYGLGNGRSSRGAGSIVWPR